MDIAVYTDYDGSLSDEKGPIGLKKLFVMKENESIEIGAITERNVITAVSDREKYGYKNHTDVAKILFQFLGEEDIGTIFCYRYDSAAFLFNIIRAGQYICPDPVSDSSFPRPDFSDVHLNFDVEMMDGAAVANQSAVLEALTKKVKDHSELSDLIKSVSKRIEKPLLSGIDFEEDKTTEELEAISLKFHEREEAGEELTMSEDIYWHLITQEIQKRYGHS